MTTRFIGCTSSRMRDELASALSYVRPKAHLVFARDAADARMRLRAADVGTFGAIVGLSDNGVSDVNLAAALVADGRASEVILVVREASGSLRSRAMQAGIALVVDMDEVEIEEPLDLVEPVTAPGDLGMAEPAGSEAKAPIIVVSSGRGGVGKTTIAALMATMAHSWGMRVALCDLDLACGNLHSLVGVPRPADLARIVGESSELVGDLGDAVAECAEGLDLVGPCALPEHAEHTMPIVSDLLVLLSQAYDLVVVDTSSTCTDGVAQAMQLADRLVLVHDEAPGALSSLARTAALAQRLGVARTRVVRVENGCATRALGKVSPAITEGGLQSARVFLVPDGGDELRDLLASGQAAELCRLGGPAVRATATMLAQLLLELGCLPACDEAQRATRGVRGRRARRLFMRGGEVAS